MRLAYSTNAYMRFEIEEALARIARLGYKGVELMADVPHLWPAETSNARIDDVRRALDQHGLAISNINAFMMNKIGDSRQPYWHPSWIEPDADYRQIRVEHTRAALTMARRLGAPCITTEPGGPIESESGYATAMNLFVENLKPIVEHAGREQVLLLIEPEPGLLIERFDQYLELRDRIDSPFMALNFDIGHAYCVAEEPAEWIPRMASHTRHYHVEDIAASRVHHHLVPGTGAIDFGATLQAIRETDYDGWLTVELYPFVEDPDTAGQEAKQYLDRVAASL
ncbi:MAG: sugar phosphate isomerase/epimerase [Phycisphaerales bacterium]|nr:sugar phosphate isomerase/epimerase [Phycisphaerales bacterium]